MRALVTALALGSSCAVAWGADLVVDRSGVNAALPQPASFDDTMELRWDQGLPRWAFCWNTGADYWIGNDFDISTIKTYGTIKAVKVYMRYNWPNTGWDGARVGIFSFNSVPASMIWPTAGGPYFFKPTGQSGWKEIPIAWVLPSAVRKFAAAVEQYYDSPNCDSVLIDSNPTFSGHTWHYLSGNWERFMYLPIAPYRNLMLRVLVANESVDVQPTSVGRVKALYF